ncbi:hypothetical protein MNB_SV-5-1516 [hydrothermal vent metagenome]|uniref:Rhs family protein n=1 Tax=hydrothermal vent metagenome TaxID=652676 RepID=A0A1W1EEU4_9ZZZZ
MKKLNAILLSSAVLVLTVNAKEITVKFPDTPIYSNHLFNKNIKNNYDKNGNIEVQHFTLTSSWSKPIVNLKLSTHKNSINYVYDFKNRKVTIINDKAFEGNMVYSFDRKGLILSSESTKGLVHNSYTYDEDGNLKTSIVQYRHHDYIKKGKYTYNEDAKVSKFEWVITPNINYHGEVFNFESSGTNVYKYFKNGNIENMESNLIFNANTKDEYTVSSSLSYDEKSDGRVLLIDNNFSNNKSSSHYQMDYDEEGNLITYIYTKTANDNSWTKHTATYTEDGELVSDYIESN